MMNKINKIFIIIVIFLSCTNLLNKANSEIKKMPAPISTSQIIQYGITWKFDKKYTCGQFANGDYWVIGPVKIINILPEYNGINNGWEINPMPGEDQGFEYGAQNFNPKLVPAIPYTAQPGESIVKSISKFPGKKDDCYACCLKTAAVLTIVNNIPPDNGATVFRPPYVGKRKPYYFINQLQTSLLPSLKPVRNTPSLKKIVDRFRRVQIQHGFGRTGRIIRPEENMNNYGPSNARDENDAILRLMLNDPIEDKMSALIVIVQYGIDTYHAFINGQTWPSGGGYEPGHKLILTFTAAMLNDKNMKKAAQAKNIFIEDLGVYRSNVTSAPGGALYGFTSPRGSWKTRKDPNEIMDAPGAGYLYGALAMVWKGAVLSVRLMPAMQSIWNGNDWDELSELIDRWVSFGWWFPSPHCKGLKSARGIPLCELHNTQANEGHRDSKFQHKMWDAYNPGKP